MVGETATLVNEIQAEYRINGTSEPHPPEPLSTRHEIRLGDARSLDWIEDESVHLVCTSPPYGMLKEYPAGDGQLGNIPDYEAFLEELDKVWAECLRVLVPGGRVACVVGDICLSRRSAGRHHVLPLSSDIQVRARQIGFDCLTPILWLKVANIALEASTSSRYLGKPNLPNGIVKNDIEHILFLRKPGGYRSPTEDCSSVVRSSPRTSTRRCFDRFGQDVSGQLRRDHPAPYPACDSRAPDQDVQLRRRHGGRPLRWHRHYGASRHAAGSQLDLSRHRIELRRACEEAARGERVTR